MQATLLITLGRMYISTVDMKSDGIDRIQNAIETMAFRTKQGQYDTKTDK